MQFVFPVWSNKGSLQVQMECQILAYSTGQAEKHCCSCMFCLAAGIGPHNTAHSVTEDYFWGKRKISEDHVQSRTSPAIRSYVADSEQGLLCMGV